VPPSPYTGMLGARRSCPCTLTPQSTWWHQRTRARRQPRCMTWAYSSEGGPVRDRNVPPNHPCGRGLLIATSAPLSIPGRASPHGLFLCPLSSALPAGCGTNATFHRITPHHFRPQIPILGTCITSPPSALFRARTSPHLRHLGIPISSTCLSPIPAPALLWTPHPGPETAQDRVILGPLHAAQVSHSVRRVLAYFLLDQRHDLSVVF
jgi:hypothetical protein